MNDGVQLIIFGLIAISIYMSLVWMASLRLRNAGIVDPAWSFGFTFMAGLYAILSPPRFPAGLILIGMYIISSLRLAWHLTTRFLRWYPKEDARYADLRMKMGESADAKMLLVFLFQGVVLAILTAPLVVSLTNRRTQLDAFGILAIALWFVSLIGEALADHQLASFTRDSNNRNKTCQSGLWKYSRHPNYFFEWLSSVSFALYVSGCPYGFLAWSSPALLLHLLFNVTGIKPSEEHSLKSRPDYADYAKRTSIFIPWSRRNVR